MTKQRTLKERLARFMDPGAFEPVPASVKHTSAAVGLTVHDKRKVRREIALKRADATIRFLGKTDNLAQLNARFSAPQSSGAVEQPASRSPSPEKTPGVEAAGGEGATL